MLGVSPQAYYQWQRRQVQRARTQALILSLVHSIRRQLPRLGTRKLWHELHKMQLRIGRDYLFKILKNNHLLVITKPRAYQTTRSGPQPARYPNLLRHHPPQAPRQAWVSDITYLRLGNSHRFLAIVADAYTRRIVGYALSNRLDTQVVGQALLQAQLHNPSAQCLLHADQGTQYNSNELANLLHHFNLKGSMSRRGIPQDNAIAERIFGILKNEFNLKQRYKNEEELYQNVHQAIHLYNHKRPHSSLNMLSPVAFEQKISSFLV